jgi:hypothetical protein
MAGIQKIERYIKNITSSATIVQLSAGDGVLLECKAEWKPKGVLEGNTVQNSNVFTLRDGGFVGVLRDGETAQDIIQVPAYGAFQWFNPWATTITKMAEILSQLRVPTDKNARPYGTFNGKLEAQFFVDPINVGHEIEFSASFLEYR